MNIKEKTAGLSVISNTLLIILKLISGIISGSVSILSEAIHSLMDLLAAVIAYFSVKISDTPPDKEHPYGHGKFENISGVVEGLLILIASFWIISEAIQNIIHHKSINSVSWGIVVMTISSIVNIIVSRRLYKVAKTTHSIALEADALHLKLDVYTSIGVAVGLLIIWLSDFLFKINLSILDPVIAILVALMIFREAFILIRKAFSPLVDIGFSNEEIEHVKQIIEKHNLKYHNLRTRIAGNYRFIDFHLEFEHHISLLEAQQTRKIIKSELQKAFEKTDVTIQTDTVNHL